HREKGCDRRSHVLSDGQSRNARTRWKQFRVETREHGVIALVNDTPHRQRESDRQRQVVDADGVEVRIGEQCRSQRSGDNWWSAAYFVGEFANKRNNKS